MAICKRCDQQVIFAQLATGQWMPPLEAEVVPLVPEDLEDQNRVIIIWDNWRGSYRAIAQGTNISAAKFHDCPNPRVTDREQDFLRKQAAAKVRAEANYSTSEKTNDDLEHMFVPVETEAETVGDDSVQIYYKELYDLLKDEFRDALQEQEQCSKLGILATIQLPATTKTQNAYREYLAAYETIFALNVTCESCGSLRGVWCTLLAKSVNFNLSEPETGLTRTNWIKTLHPKRRREGWNQVKRGIPQ